ncbi:MAG: hypothetical protein HN929_00885 [Chloroflexi bacterium]|nr:hypothetical protein [Chloroflexota bacterium]
MRRYKDIDKGNSHSLYIMEASAQYQPRLATGAVAIPSTWLTKLFLTCWNHEDTLKWRQTGALAQAQFVQAFQGMVSQLSNVVSSALDTIIIGPDGRYTIMSGGFTELPASYIF